MNSYLHLQNMAVLADILGRRVAGFGRNNFILGTTLRLNLPFTLCIQAGYISDMFLLHATVRLLFLQFLGPLRNFAASSLLCGSAGPWTGRRFRCLVC